MRWTWWGVATLIEIQVDRIGRVHEKSEWEAIESRLQIGRLLKLKIKIKLQKDRLEQQINFLANFELQESPLGQINGGNIRKAGLQTLINPEPRCPKPAP